MKFEVIADYPNSRFYVGQIIELVDNKYEYYEYDGKYWMYESEFNEYPHIFKPIKDEPTS